MHVHVHVFLHRYLMYNQYLLSGIKRFYHLVQVYMYVYTLDLYKSNALALDMAD